MSWAAGQIPRSILGWYLGPAALGIYVLADRLAGIIIQIVIVPRTSVARIKLRHFSEDPISMASAFNNEVRQTALLSFPISFGLAAIIPTLFVTFLGSQWQPGIVTAQIMALIVIPLTFFYCCTAALLAARQPHLDSWSSILLTTGNVLTVFLAAPFGINIVCGALVLQTVIFLPIPLLMLSRACGSSPFVIVWKQLPLLGAAAIMGIGVMMVTPFITVQIGYITTIPVLIVIGAAIYLPLAALVAPNDTRRLVERVTSSLQSITSRNDH
jgi:PST family polysaccharide transporter